MWIHRKVGDVCEFISRGLSPKYIDDGGITVLNQKCIRDHSINYSLARRHDANEKKVRSELLIKTGDVLVNSTGQGTLGRVAQVRGDVLEPTIVDSHITIVRPKDGLFNNDFFGRAIETIERQLQNAGHGSSGQTELPRARISEEFSINFPDSIEEQKRIAAILDQAEELKQKRQRSLDLLEELKQSIFFDMFLSKDGTEWPVARVSDLSTNMRTGPFGSDLLHSEFVSEGISVLGIDNAVQNRFTWSESRFITPEKYNQLKRYTVKPRDLLITIMGTVGRCAIVPNDIPTSVNTKHLCCITLDQSRVLPEFLHSAFLGHPDILRQLGMQTKGAVMPGLNMGIIKGLKIQVPPMKLQEKYVKRLNKLLSLEVNIAGSDQKINELFVSLQHNAFSGELSGVA